MTGSVVKILADRIGLDLSTVGETLVVRAIESRMASLRMVDRAGYEAKLAQCDAEQQALVEEIVIPESWFFRDDRPFQVLRDHVRGGWVGNPSRPPLRALSLPCANGEEPYSVAITFLELGLPATRFRVDGVDVSHRCLERAAAGLYGKNAFRAGAMPDHSPYFRPVGGRVEVAPEVRRSVRFSQGNILDPNLFANDGPYDIILCRNLLIYFDSPARRAAFDNLARLLTSDGLLFLGHADRAPDLRQFVPVDDRSSFAFRHAPACSPAVTAQPTPSRATSPRTTATPPAPPIGRRDATPIPPTAEAHPQVHPAGYVPPSRWLEQATERADQGQLDEATRLCERVIREAGPSAASCFLLGVIREAAGDRKGAEAQFSRAVYLDAHHDEALLALAVLARRRGDLAAESGYRRRAERARARKGTAT